MTLDATETRGDVPRDALALDALVERARAIVITDATQYQRAADFVLGLKDLRADIDRRFDRHIKRAYEAHRALVAEKRDAEAQAVNAERIVKQAMATYDTQLQQAIDAERARRDDEQRAANATLEAAATQAETRGDFSEADALRQRQSMAPTPLEVERPRAEGISVRETWSARVVDFDALVRAAATTKAYVALLLPNMPALHAQARSLKRRLSLPGVEAVSTKDVAARR